MAKFCIHCGSKLGDTDKFCMHCGAKCADMTPSDTSEAQSSASQIALEKAEQILLSSQAIPNYSKALVYLVEAKKQGVKTKKMETLMLLDQLYRTIDMLRQSYAGAENSSAKTKEDISATQPAPYTLLEHRQHSAGIQQSTDSGNKTSNMGTYMKAAAIGAVTGAVANTLMGHHDVQARDDMLNLMRSDYDTNTADDDADSSDMTYDENAADSTDYTNDDSSYDATASDASYEENDDDNWTDTDDSYDDSDTDSSFDYDDGGDDFF